MSDLGDDFRLIRQIRRDERARLGRVCPECVRLLPKAPAAILLPRQRCRIHNYRDPRDPARVDANGEPLDAEKRREGVRETQKAGESGL
jgi:hypothetical protein